MRLPLALGPDVWAYPPTADGGVASRTTLAPVQRDPPRSDYTRRGRMDGDAQAAQDGQLLGVYDGPAEMARWCCTTTSCCCGPEELWWS